MDKIAELLKQLGVSDEGIKQIIESLDSFQASVEKKYEDQFQTRLEKAKQVCLEEVENYKIELRRKVEIFFESRTNAVNREAQRQAAIGESGANKTLRELKSLLDGVPLEGVSGATQALADQNQKLRQKVASMQESLAASEKSRERLHGIASKSLQRIKVLESQTPRTATTAEVATESKEPQRGPTKPKLETLRQKVEQPKTSRPVLVESVAKQSPEQSVSSPGADPAISKIAASIETAPAYVK
jgi:hypothetical protein